MSLRMRSRSLDLSLPAQPPPAEGEKVLPSMRTPPGPKITEAQRVGGRINRWLKRDAGERNVQAGRVHPALYSLLRRIQEQYAPDQDMIPSRMRSARRELVKAYKAGIAAFNEMGSALPLDLWETGKRISPPKLLAGKAAISEAVTARGTQLLRTEICVDVAPGERPVITRRIGSRARKLDRHALEALGQAMAAGGAMPADMPAFSACYRFDVRFGRALPRLSAALVFDALVSGRDWQGPAKKVFTHKVSLSAAWKGAGKGAGLGPGSVEGDPFSGRKKIQPIKRGTQ